MKKILILFFSDLLFLTTPHIMRAQQADEYSFSVSSGSYTAINGSGLSMGEADDGEAVIPLPFTFRYGNNTYDSILVSTNGMASFGYSTYYSYLNSLAATSCINVLAPFWEDLSSSSASGHISYQTSGVYPNRTLTIQYADVFYVYASNYSLNFQIRLHETSNVIEFVYGSDFTSFVYSYANALIGINSYDSSTVFFTGITPTGGTTAAFSTTTANNYLEQNEINQLFSGLTYTFTPYSCFRPSNAEATDITTTGAIIDWLPIGDESEWELEWKDSSDTVWNSCGILFSATYTLNGLIPITSYDVRIRALCSATEQSNWALFSFATLCDAISAFPYSESFDNYTSAVTFPLCWTQITNNSTAYPCFNFANPSSAPRCLQFSATNAYYCYAVSPRIDPAISISQLQVHFKAKIISSSITNGHLEIGIMSDPEEIGTFTVLGNTSRNDFEVINTWHDFEVPLSDYTGTGEYIAFRAPNEEGNAQTFIDDVVFDYAPDCVSPWHFMLEDYGYHSVNVSWSPRGFESSWDVMYGNRGFDTTAATIYYVTDTVFSLSGLTDTNYTIYVRANCSNGTLSHWAKFNFSIPCHLISSTPYSETFDTYGPGNSVFPDCWTRLTNNSNNYPYISSGASYSSPNSLYFYSSNSDFCYAVSPPIDLVISVADLQVSFNASIQGNYIYDMHLDVGVMTNPTDFTTFTTIESIHYSDFPVIGNWYGFSIPLSAYTSNGQFIALRAPSEVYSYFYLDNFVVDRAATCLSPILLTANHITSTTADITWHPRGTGYRWEVAYGTAGFDPATGGNVMTTFDTLYSLATLNPNTVYSVYVRALCDNDTSVWSSVCTFTTPCFPVSSLPFMENFDACATGTLPDCWSLWTTTGSNASVNNTGYSPPNSLNYTSSSYNFGYLVLPEFDTLIPVNGLQITFKLRSNNLSCPLFVGVMTDPGTDSTFTLVQTINSSNTNTWEEYNILFNHYLGNGQYIALKTENCYNSHRIDDIEIDSIPYCIKPDSIVSSDIRQNNITLSWRERGEAINWEIEYGPAGFIHGNGTHQYVFSKPYTIDSLSPSTEYDVYIRSVCNGIYYSNWSNKYTFRTACAHIDTLPYTENFDSYEDNTFPICWIEEENSPVVDSSYYAYSFYKTLYYNVSPENYSIAVLPEIDSSILVNTLKLNLKILTLSSTAQLKVGVMSDPAVDSTFFLIKTISPPAAYFWNEYDILFNNYSGNGHYIALKSENYTNAVFKIYLDDIELDTIPDCIRPDSIIVLNTTSASANIFWREWNASTMWNVEYGPANFIPGTGTMICNVVNNPFPITGLTPSNTYDLYIQTVCSENKYSDWSVKKTFRTDCNRINSLPYMENFDTYGYGRVFSTLFPACWLPNNAITNYSEILNNNTYSPPGAFYCSTASYQQTINSLPLFDTIIAISSLQAVFKLYKEILTSTLSVGVMTNPTVDSTFELIQTVTPSTTDHWEEFDVCFNSYTGNGHYIAFKAENSAIYMDDIAIDTIPYCVKPDNIYALSATASTIELSWRERGHAVAWNIEYDTAGFIRGTGTTLHVFSNPCLITGLMPSAKYDFYIQSDCATDTGSWTNVVSLYTSQILYTMPGIIDFEDTTENAEWELIGGNQINQWHIGSAVNNTVGGNNALYVSNDNGLSNLYTNTMSIIWAYRDIYFTPSDKGYSFKFDWKGMGEAFSDYMNVYIGDITAPVSAGSYQIGGEAFPVFSSLFLQSFWKTDSAYLDPSFSGKIKRLYFFWRNDYSSFGNPPAAVDNIEITAATCPPPQNLSINNITTSSADISWTPRGDENNWLLEYKRAEDRIYTLQYCQSASFSLNNLQSSTTYDIRVKALCGTNDDSFYLSSSFTTVISYRILATAGDNGAIVPSGDIMVAAGNSQTFLIVPDDGFSALSVFIDSNNIGTVDTFTFTNVSANHTIHVDFILGLDENITGNNIAIFPNPVDNLLHIQSDMNIESVEIRNVFGQVLYQKEMSNKYFDINVSSFASGIYFICIKNENGITAIKFMKT